MRKKIILCPIISIVIFAQPASGQFFQSNDIVSYQPVDVSIAPAISDVDMQPRKYFTEVKFLAGESKDSPEITDCVSLINGSVTADFKGSYSYAAQLSGFNAASRFNGEFSPKVMAFSFNGQVQNSCSKNITGYVHLYIIHDITKEEVDVAHSSKPVILGEVKTCGATVNNLDIDLMRGENKSFLLSLPKTGTAEGTITITGQDLTAEGVLLLGGDATIKAVPTDSSYIDSNGNWVAGPDETTGIPLSISVGNDAPPGVHTSVMTATINCN
ncbi:hypothetical protein CBF16_22880 (plasmid) [Pantoea agglomerans]|uniref:hypothetical protein n=1 Tax=Enterobacter agglomerans TaxID=549 RepID=UPI000F5E370F|nr:hypothetical protein [Pantoea agglomerans]AZI53719.1 hypothetical protein CBF16_22880 [Pantoea agglomerans]